MVRKSEKNALFGRSDISLRNSDFYIGCTKHTILRMLSEKPELDIDRGFLVTTLGLKDI